MSGELRLALGASPLAEPSRLLSVGFGEALPGADLCVPMVSHGPHGCENWWTDQPVSERVTQDVHVRECADWMALWAHEPHLLADPVSGTQRIYSRMLQIVHAAGFGNPLRMWNYLPGINSGVGDEECYRKFCVGRADGIRGSALAELPLPAASAVGHGGPDGLYVCAIAGRVDRVALENPNQVPAWQYPREYGPASPSFSRGVRTELPQPTLLLSGTASISGHASQSAGSLREQLSLTLENIHALHGASDLAAILPNTGGVKVYVRRPQHVREVQAMLDASSLSAVPRCVLTADICRSELLVEVEGVLHCAPALD